MLRVLLIGRKLSIVEETEAQAQKKGARLFAATNLAEAEAMLKKHDPHALIIGAGVDLEQRVGIVRAAFQQSDKVEIHMKDAESGPEGFTPFVEELLDMLARQRGDAL